MNNFHVYRDGRYDRKENLKIKARDLAKKTITDLDAWFVRLYEVKQHCPRSIAKRQPRKLRGFLVVL